MHRLLGALALAAGIALSAPVTGAVAQEGPLKAELAVSKIVNPGTEEESAVEADAARPGDILEYRGTYANVSEEPLSGLVINGPVPENTSYISDATEASRAATFQVLVEDEDWQGLPAYKTVTLEDGSERRVEATPADYLEIRWKLDGPLAPEATFSTQYRVKVDQ